MVSLMIFNISGSVIVNIWWKVVILTCYTIALCLIQETNFGNSYLKIEFPQTLIPVLGLVIGLLLVFRTNTAYERYWEGRKIWGNMATSIRTLTRTIWLIQDNDESIGQIESNLEKISAIRLIVAFAITTKNLLQGKETLEPDLRQMLKPNWNIKHTVFESKRNAEMKGISWSQPTPQELMEHPDNIPLEITYHFSLYIKSVQRRELVDTVTYSGMNNGLFILVESLTGFERVLRTPIPLAYSIHLIQTLWIYLLALPYQLIGSIGWFSVPAVAISSFALIGILAIGEEIEDPFGSDSEWGSENDLPLNKFCQDIQLEIQKLLDNPSWIGSYSQSCNGFGNKQEGAENSDSSTPRKASFQPLNKRRSISHPYFNESINEKIGQHESGGSYEMDESSGGLLQSWC